MVPVKVIDWENEFKNQKMRPLGLPSDSAASLVSRDLNDK